MPKRLAAKGVKPYTWTEFAADTILPIPFEEGAKEVFHHMNNPTAQQEHTAVKAVTTILLMAATGGRLSDDWDRPELPHATPAADPARAEAIRQKAFGP